MNGGDLVLTLLAHVEHARLKRPAHPFVAARRVRIATDGVQRKRDHARRLRAVQVTPDSALAAEAHNLVHRHHDPGRCGDVGNLHDACAGRAKRADPGDITRRIFRIRIEGLHDDAPQPLLLRPRIPAARMRVGFEDHLVAGAELKSRGDNRVSLGGVAHEGDLRRIGS